MPITLVESLTVHPEAVPDVFKEHEYLDGQATIPMFSEDELRRHQRADPIIGRLVIVISLMESGEPVAPHLTVASPDLKLMTKEWSRLDLKNCVLYRNRQKPTWPSQGFTGQEWLLILRGKSSPVVGASAGSLSQKKLHLLSIYRPQGQWNWYAWTSCP